MPLLTLYARLRTLSGPLRLSLSAVRQEATVQSSIWTAEESLTFMVSSSVSSQPCGQPPALSAIQPLASLQVTIFAFQMFFPCPPTELQNPKSAHIRFYNLKKINKFRNEFNFKTCNGLKSLQSETGGGKGERRLIKAVNQSQICCLMCQELVSYELINCSEFLGKAINLKPENRRRRTRSRPSKKVSLRLLNPKVQAGSILKEVGTSPVLNILLYH